MNAIPVQISCNQTEARNRRTNPLSVSSIYIHVHIHLINLSPSTGILKAIYPFSDPTNGYMIQCIQMGINRCSKLNSKWKINVRFRNIWLSRLILHSFAGFENIWALICLDIRIHIRRFRSFSLSIRVFYFFHSFSLWFYISQFQVRIQPLLPFTYFICKLATIALLNGR